MEKVTCTDDDGVLVVQITRWGRLWAALTRWLVIVPVAFFAAVVFFTPDLMFGTVRQEEPVPGLFVLTLLGLAVAGATLFSVSRYLRWERWIFDGEARKVFAEARTMFGMTQRGDADLRDISHLLLDARSGVVAVSRLGLELKDGHQEILLSGRGIGDEVQKVGEAVKEYLRECRYPVELIDVDESETGGESDE